ncbi:MAG TPA: TlpA family protein disulfide reductase [Candidatus Aquabacterium excrementipullorum]|nr:TlpA family protein disulfide reductase [Candidatus Aquabacterium excrementipullorum]
MDNPSTAAAPASPRNSSRRLWLAGGIAALAGLGGGLWWARHREGAPDAERQGEALPPDFWGHQFDTVGGTPLKFADFQGKPLVVNFWATWCPPCVKEMPDLDRFHQAHNGDGWHVIGVAIDSATPVKGFLGRTPVHFPIGLAGFGGTEMAQVLGNTAGALPFTVVIDAHGRIRQRKMGPTHLDELSGWAREFG